MADSIRVAQPIRLQYLHWYTSRILLETASLLAVLWKYSKKLHWLHCYVLPVSISILVSFLISYYLRWGNKEPAIMVDTATVLPTVETKIQLKKVRKISEVVLTHIIHLLTNITLAIQATSSLSSKPCKSKCMHFKTWTP